MSNRLSDLIDIPQLRRLCEIHTLAVGIPVAILDADGNVLAAVGWRDICTQFHHNHPATIARCTQSGVHIHSRPTPNGYIEYRCQNGMLEIAIPIVVDGENVGTLFLGQFFYEDEQPDTGHFCRQAEEFGFDLDAYCSALAEVPILPRAQVTHLARYYTEFVSLLAAIGTDRLQLANKQQCELALDHLVHHDALTDLPNRKQFARHLGELLRRTGDKPKSLAVLFVDLDRFKLINDTQGHHIGDILLKDTAARFRRCVREPDMLARMGGDEFAVILGDIRGVEDAAAVAGRMIDSLAKPFLIDGHDFYISASIGISLCPTDGNTVDALIRGADTAMFSAKEGGRNNYHLHTQDMMDKAHERINLEQNIRKALTREEFVVHYQPKVEIATGRIVGLEALVRWQHPDLGLVPPSQFIPLAEETGLIIPLGVAVLQTACAQNRAWLDEGLLPAPISVNVSAAQFLRGDLVDTLARVLQDTGLNPAYLELELTESTLMVNPEIVAETLRTIKEMNIGVSIDDFGTGYSSLSYLKRFPVGTLKIDRSFVRDITTDPDDAAIARAVVAMAHSLNLKVVAEGVETMEQLEFLRYLDCDAIQGYLVSRPLDAEQMHEFLQACPDGLYSFDSQPYLAA